MGGTAPFRTTILPTALDFVGNIRVVAGMPLRRGQAGAPPPQFAPPAARTWSRCGGDSDGGRRDRCRCTCSRLAPRHRPPPGRLAERVYQCGAVRAGSAGGHWERQGREGGGEGTLSTPAAPTRTRMRGTRRDGPCSPRPEPPASGNSKGLGAGAGSNARWPGGGREMRVKNSWDTGGRE
jgi:hypothetical protein